MIICFSGTGNTLAVARRLSEATGEHLYRIDSWQPKGLPELAEGERLGFVFPVYGWDMPRVVKAFFKKVALPKTAADTYIYMVCTCGDDIGHTDRLFQKALARHGLQATSLWSVLMPDTYIALPGFDIDNSEETADKLREASRRVDAIAESVRLKKTQVVDVKNGAFAWTKTHVLGWFFDRFLVKEKKFRLSPKCIGCGKCAQACPLDNIAIGADQKPKWQGHCTGCLACFHACPVHAIDYGRFTKNKGQYRPKEFLPHTK